MDNKGGRVCIGTDNGCLVFRPGPEGEDWELVHHGLYGYQVTCVAEHQDGTLFAGAAHGMVYTTEDFENWKPLFEGLEIPNVYSLHLDPENQQRLFAGTSPAALFESVNRGLEWHRLESFQQVPSTERWSHPEPPHSPRVTRLFRHGRSALFAAVQVGGVLASFDDGVSWEDRSDGLPAHIHDLVAPLTAPDRLYATCILGFFRSDDLGESWRESNGGLPYIDARALAVDPEDPDHLLLAVDRPNHLGSVIFSSRDGGTRWEIAQTELPAAEDQRVTALGAGVGYFYASTCGGQLFGSEDGNHWYPLRPDLPPIRTLIPLRGQRARPLEAQQIKGDSHED